MATLTKNQQRLRAEFAVAKQKIRAALIHNMYLHFDKKKRLVKIMIGESTFYPTTHKGEVRIMYCGREFAEYTVDEFIERYSFN